MGPFHIQSSFFLMCYTISNLKVLPFHFEVLSSLEDCDVPKAERNIGHSSFSSDIQYFKGVTCDTEGKFSHNLKTQSDNRRRDPRLPSYEKAARARL